MADENKIPDAGDPGETLNVGGSGESAGANMETKPDKEEWSTVVSPKIQRPAPANPPASQPPAPKPDAESTMLEGSSSAPSAPPPMAAPMSQPTPGASAGYSTTPPVIESAPTSSGGMAWMEGIGIKDPGTQKIVLFGGGGALLLCCLCSCVAIALPMLSSFSFGP